MKINKLPAGKDTELKAKCTSLGLTIKNTRQVERTRPLADGTPETVLDNLATVELQDGSTITVDVDNPEHANIVERAAERTERQIQGGNKLRKPKA